ncbi:N-methyl-L-tryptophan oxidase [Pseudomonas sp. BCA14]|uniref:N-methyl-L-tryptophan oxidase n=1 Tax=unclassified Pseudomonas TaxID=196821 RepID=UPI00106DDD0A|nr:MULTISPECIES: N-methyl-L-tryptophan oxidase [unclassified Pseudomonas]TFF13464.1 N-methyl-L-tryptophan oxidase [Pseudomonas sp. JMN1]TFF15852.1 N-methyl-L-tryptophan oxidase [Pseudomonas sp. BCA17]TFF29787.1 N-methyl-L-tryptophan oxidase [Pseudomonas sp. BCA13]TFF30630.1 N-methyl-L-tryptophan oxidase [Pseudomonas sp. BCA14]
MERYESLVIGLGAMGAATVYQLAKAGVKVAGIDRHHPPHTLGSSHGDTRITRLSVGEGAQYVPIVRNSHRIWRELEARSGESLFEQSGLLVLTSREDFDPGDETDFTLRTIGLAQTYGIEHQILDAPQIRQRFPQFAHVADSAIGYYEPGGGFVRPERCIEVQLRLAEQQGATLYTGETVTHISSDEHGVTVTTDQRTLQAGKLVVSAGNWAGDLLGAPFDRLLKVYRQQLFWFELEPGAALVGASPTFILTHGPGESHINYGFPALPGEGSLKVATAQYHTASTPQTLDRTVSPAQEREMYAQQVQGRIAGLTAKVVKSAVCAYTVTPDHHFIIDKHPTLQHTLVVSPCSGHGFKHSAALGEAFAQWCIRGTSELDLSSFSLQRFEGQTF